MAMHMLSEVPVKRRGSTRNFPRAPSRLSFNKEEPESVISYKDIMEALNESLNGESKFGGAGAFSSIQDRAAGDSRISISSVQYDTDTDTEEASYAFQSDSDYSEEAYGSRLTSVSSDSDSEVDSKVMNNIPLETLLEQGSESSIGKYLVPPIANAFSRPRVSSFQETLTQARVRRPSRFSLSLPARKNARPELESFLDLTSSVVSDREAEATSDSESDSPHRCSFFSQDHLLYSPQQTALFGDFLYAPFAPTTPGPGSSSSSSSSPDIGPGPLDADAHEPWECKCDRCDTVNIAMTREFSEVHPYISSGWLASIHSGYEGDD